MIYAGAPQQRAERSIAVARKVQPLFIDDLDGSQAEATVRSGLDGNDCEIGLDTGYANRREHQADARRNGRISSLASGSDTAAVVRCDHGVVSV